MKSIILLFLVGVSFCCEAQNALIDGHADYESMRYRPRIAEFTVANLYEYNTVSNSEQYGTSATEIERDHKIKARLGIPIVMKPNLLVGIQLKYDRQQFLLDFEDNIPYDLYRYIQDSRLTSLGGRFMIQKKFDNSELSVLAGTELKSDDLSYNKNTTKHFLNVNYKIRKREDLTIGGGLAVAYTLGIPQIYPLFYYEKAFNPRWTMDLALPKAAIVRFKATNKCFVSFKTEVKGWRYAVHDAVVSEEAVLTLRKSDLRVGLNIEHELHDWLWLGIDGGWSKNLRHFLAKPGDRRRDALINLNSSDSPYMNLSIFIVPPKKIYNKM